MSVVLPAHDSSTGWEFVSPGEQQERYPECGPDASGLNARYLDEFYQQGCYEYTGKVTVPVLWVRKACHSRAAHDLTGSHAFSAQLQLHCTCCKPSQNCTPSLVFLSVLIQLRVACISSAWFLGPKQNCSQASAEELQPCFVLLLGGQGRE